MAKDKEPFEALTANATRTAEQITKQTQDATENYFGWLQTAMSALPWSKTNLNSICPHIAQPLTRMRTANDSEAVVRGAND
jgi:hypothetical protein